MDLREWSPNVLHRHPWETTRARFFGRILVDAGLHHAPIRAVDVGGGDGWLAAQLLKVLHPESTVVCWDTEYTAEHLQRLASAASASQRFSRVQPSGTFDLVLCMDVLEHVDQDGDMLGSLVEHNVRPGGHLLFSVPAWPALFSSHDASLGHFRRYSPTNARRLVDGCRLAIMRSGGLFHSLLVPRLARRLVEALGHRSRFKHAGNWSDGAMLTRAVEGALALDSGASLLLARLRLDLPGLSWWALCRKPA